MANVPSRPSMRRAICSRVGISFPSVAFEFQTVGSARILTSAFNLPTVFAVVPARIAVRHTQLGAWHLLTKLSWFGTWLDERIKHRDHHSVNWEISTH
jgi:hypothetical protein